MFYGLEKKQEMTSPLLAESYWPSRIGRVAPVLAELRFYWQSSLHRPSLSLI